MNTDVEINSGFIKQIEELPSDLKDPVENTLEYIKKRAACSDYEAAQIQTLMSEQSGQKQGYKYYCRYIAGQSTPEEDSADYYKSIRQSWNRFLDKFSRMSLDERVEAFTVFSGSEKALEILEGSGGDKLDFISEKTEDKLDALERKAEELESKSTAYLTTHLNYTLDSAKEIEAKSDEYFDSVIRSEIEYNITSHSEDSDRLSFNARANALKLKDAVRKVDSDVVLEKGVSLSTSLRENTMLQFSVGDKYHDSFKWFIITNIESTGEACDLLTLDYHPYNQDDEKIDFMDEFDEEIKALQPKIQKLKNVPVDELKSSKYNIPHHLILKKEDLEVEDLLYSAHELDSSSLLKKLKEQPPQVKEENNDEGGSIVSAVIKLIAGVMSLVVAAIMIACSIIVAAIGLILTGLGSILSGVKNLIVSLTQQANCVKNPSLGNLKKNIKEYNQLLKN